MVGDCIGDDEFKPESNARPLLLKKTNEATAFCGGEIAGELHMGIFLRFMTGASYLDLLIIYDVSSHHIYNSFEKAAN